MSDAIYRPARPGEGGEIARMVRQLAQDIGASTVPRVTADDLEALAFGPNPLLFMHMVEVDARAVGTIVCELIYSTWRGALGLYVCDLHIDAPWRGRGLGIGLLRAARDDHPRAAFFKLEVTDDNEAARRFYRRHGFEMHHDERTFVLSGDDYRRL